MKFPIFALLALALAAATPALADPSPEIARALNLLKAGKGREAVATLEAAIARNQSDVDALITLSAIYLNSEMPDEALAQAQAAVRAAPDHQEALLTRGMAWEAKGDNGKAMADYDRILAIGPYAPALHNRALLHSKAGDHERALADLRAARKLAPEELQTAFGVALELEALNRYDDALVAYDEALGLDPTDYDVLVNKIELLEHMERWDAAGSAYGVLIKAYPKDAKAQSAYGGYWLARGDNAKALAAFTLATRLDPDLAQAWWNRGVILRDDGRLKPALEALDRAVVLNPADAELLTDRALARWDAGDARARADLDAALKIDPKSAYALYTRGRYHGEGEDWAKAIADFDAALAADPKYDVAYSARAIAYLEQGRHDRALADVKQGIALSPTAYKYGVRGMIYDRMGDHLQAVEAYDEAIRLDSTLAYLWLRRSESKTELGDAAGAAADRAQALKLDPKVAD